MDFYFVNSYAFVPEEKSFEIAKTNYDIDFCSIISKENIFGAQFHPEFTSRPNRPNPLFRAFVEAAILFSENKQTSKLKNKSK